MLLWVHLGETELRKAGMLLSWGVDGEHLMDEMFGSRQWKH